MLNFYVEQLLAFVAARMFALRGVHNRIRGGTEA